MNVSLSLMSSATYLLGKASERGARTKHVLVLALLRPTQKKNVEIK